MLGRHHHELLCGIRLTAVERTNSAEVDSSVNFRFKGDLQQAFEELEGLSLGACFLWYSSKRSKDLLLRRLWKEEMFLGN